MAKQSSFSITKKLRARKADRLNYITLLNQDSNHGTNEPPGMLSGSLSGGGNLVGAQRLGVKMAGGISAGGRVTGAVFKGRVLVGGIGAGGALSGALRHGDLLGGAIAANGNIIGALQVTPAVISTPQLLAGGVQGNGNLAGALRGAKVLAGAVSGAGRLTATERNLKILAGGVSGAGVLTATILGRKVMAGAVSGAGTLTATVKKLKQLAGGVSGAGAVTGALTNTAPATYSHGIFVPDTTDTTYYNLAYDRNAQTGVLTKNPSLSTMNFTLIANTNDTEFSPDGTHIAFGISASPFMEIWKQGTNKVYTKLTAPFDTAPAATVSGGSGNDLVKYSPSGQYLAVAQSASPYLLVYKKTGDSYAKLTLGTLPAGPVNAIAWSADETQLAVAHNTSPFITIYNRSGDTFTKRTNPSSLPSASTGANAVAFSPDGTLLAVGLDQTPRFEVYNVSALTKVTTPSYASTLGAPCMFSPEGTHLYFGGGSAIFKYSGGTFTQLSSPFDTAPGSGQSARYSSDGNYLYIANTTSPRIYAYSRSGDTYTKLADPANIPGSGIRSTGISGFDKTYVPKLSFRSQSSGQSSGAQTTVALPAGAAAGDLLIAHVGTLGSPLGSPPNINGQSMLNADVAYGTSGNAGIAVYAKLLTSGDITSGTLTIPARTSGNAFSVHMMAFSGGAASDTGDWTRTNTPGSLTSYDIGTMTQAAVDSVMTFAAYMAANQNGNFTTIQPFASFVNLGKIAGSANSAGALVIGYGFRETSIKLTPAATFSTTPAANTAVIAALYH
jgi:hypothetical protein